MRKPALFSRLNGVLSALGPGRRGGHSHARRVKGRRLAFEPLEDRQLLSLCTWTGGGADNNWSTAANWSRNGQQQAPQAGDNLLFQGTAQTTTHNDLAAGTSFNSIEFADAGFSISGNAFSLGGSGTVLVADQSAEIDAEVDMPGSANRGWTVAQNKTLTLGGAVNFTGFEFFINGPGTAEFHGAVGGSGGSNWLRGNSGVTITFEDQSSLTVLGIIVGSYSAGTLNWDSSGTLDAGYLLVSYGSGGECGTINQTAGVVSGSVGLFFGSADSYNLDGGTLSTCEIGANSGATLTFGGGTLLATAASRRVRTCRAFFRPRTRPPSTRTSTV